ncbi:uncharacterized protein [Linepithema humile]|uniref:uncharacterized protein isoform X2 n=1 Tax=Linepithema humile TaxID=83485 RepID=UPI00351DD9B1
MFLILKLLLIILLNESYAYFTQDTEIILLPPSYPAGAKEIPLTLKAFGQLIQLNLRRNDLIVSPTFPIWKYNAKITKKWLQLNVSNPCYYYHEDDISSATINFCGEHGFEGLVFMENDTLKIRPLRNKFTPLCLIDDFRKHINLSFGKPHLIKRSLQHFVDLNLYHWDKFKMKRRHVRNARQNLTVELAVFYDKAAYFTSLFLDEHNADNLHDIILDYVNSIQDAFNRPSLDVFINFTLISLDYMKEEQSNLQISDDDAVELLSSFCKYASSLNPSNDNDPRHWDIGLYLTGLKLYENIIVMQPHYRTEKNYNIKGISYHDGACNPLYSCAVVEFGDSSEITSPFEVIYKIGNLLGLTQERSSTDSQKYVTWSEDSRNKIEKLWETKTCLRDQAKTMIIETENINNDNTRKKLNNNMTIKLAVFLDETAYNMYFIPFLDNNKEKLRNMISEYVNRIQAAFNHPSLDVFINITLINLKVLKKSLLNSSLFNDDVDELLDSFCTYANSLNPSNDNDPRHWNIGLYLTGVNLYENITVFKPHYRTEKNYNIKGISYQDGACNPLLSCAVVEFRDSSEITSSLEATYKIGNLLGLTQERSSTDSQKYVTWYEDSRNKIEKLWETKTCLRDQAKTMIIETGNINNDNTRKNLNKNMTIKLAVFLDETAYNIYFKPLLDNNEKRLRNMISEYVNRIQAAFNHPSLDVFINITLINLKVLKKSLLNLSLFDDDVDELLDLFCTYANSLNPSNDNDPRHWDIGLYLTGVNLYENITVFKPHYRTEKNYNIKGISYQDGACNPLLSCAVVELRDSSEITSSLEATYKIGNLLGLTQERSSTDSQKYVTWYEDSRNKIEKLWETKTCFRDQAKTMISIKENIDADNTRKNLNNTITIKLAVFLDEAVYNTPFIPLQSNNEERIRNMTTEYVNRIQAAFNHSNLDAFVNISLIPPIIVKKHLSNLSIFDGDAEELLNSFCVYANSLNPSDDNDSRHWDIGLYLTGVNLYENINVNQPHYKTEKNYNITGISYQDGAIDPFHSCAVVEFRDSSEITSSLEAIYKIGNLIKTRTKF